MEGSSSGDPFFHKINSSQKLTCFLYKRLFVTSTTFLGESIFRGLCDLKMEASGRPCSQTTSGRLCFNQEAHSQKLLGSKRDSKAWIEMPTIPQQGMHRFLHAKCHEPLHHYNSETRTSKKMQFILCVFSTVIQHSRIHLTEGSRLDIAQGWTHLLLC